MIVKRTWKTNKSEVVFIMFARMISGLQDKKGQGMVEYVLIISFIAVMLVGALVLTEGGLTAAYTRISDALK